MIRRNRATPNGLAAIKGRLGSSPEQAHRIVSAARKTLHKQDVERLVQWILEREHISNRVATFTPTTFSDLFATQQLTPLALEEELVWTTQILLSRESLLKSYVSVSNGYYRLALLEEHELASQALDHIDEQFGVSVWSLGQRIALLQNWKGLERQKQYAKSFWSSDAQPLTKLVAYLISARTEPSTTQHGFVAWMNRFFADLDWSGPLPDYLREVAAPAAFIQPRVAALKLVFSVSASVVDAYHALANAAGPLLIDGAAPVQDVIADHVIPLMQRCGDRRCSLAGHLLSPSDAPLNTAAAEAAAALFSGNPQRAASEALQILDVDPLDHDAWTIAAYGCAELSTDPEGQFKSMQKSAIQMGKLLRGGSPTDKAAEDINKLAASIGDLPVSAAAMATVEGLRRPTASLPRANRGHIAAINSVAALPVWLDALSDLDDAAAYAAPAASTGQTSAATQLADMIVTGHRADSRHLSPTFVRLLSAQRALVLGQFADVVAATDDLLAVGQYARRKLARIRCESLLRTERLQQCVDETTSLYLADTDSHQMLPIAALAATCKERAPVKFVGDISVPILFDIYSQRIGKKLDSERSFAYADFLRANLAKTPSQLEDRSIQFPREKWTYFLRYVCIESVMARSRQFKSSRAVLQERVAVCRMLSELDAVNAQVYQAEIRELLQRLMIQQRMRQLDQHKIYVDLDSLRRASAAKLREMFNRYQDLRIAQPNGDVVNTAEVLEAVRKATAGDKEELASLRLPTSPAADLLKQLVLGLRDEFLSSPEHGLDKYLSVRIRHGTCAAQLRAPLEAANLLTARESSTGRYQKNRYWPQHLGLSGDVAAELEARLNDFSAVVTDWIDEWLAAIQITTVPDSEKIFDFSITEPTLRVVAVEVEPTATVSEFIDFVVDRIFNAILDLNLEHARRRIRLVLKPAAAHMMQELADDVARLSSSPNTFELVDTIRAAGTELQTALDRVAAWFYRTDSVLAEPFSLHDALLLGAETIKAVSPQFSIQSAEGGAELLQLRGPLFNPFVDVFLLIFQNVVRHSGLDTPVATVSLSVKDDRTSFTVAVFNQVAADTVTEASRERVSSIKARLNSAEHQKFVSRERGTGFHKLKNILTHDFDPDAEVDFGFGADDGGAR